MSTCDLPVVHCDVYKCLFFITFKCFHCLKKSALLRQPQLSFIYWYVILLFWVRVYLYHFNTFLYKLLFIVRCYRFSWLSWSALFVILKWDFHWMNHYKILLNRVSLCGWILIKMLKLSRSQLNFVCKNIVNVRIKFYFSNTCNEKDLLVLNIFVLEFMVRFMIVLLAKLAFN